ncbi:hypothetical protein [Pseudactinotalea sp. HY158]|uniref:hypothetical protein n=1 Tax=Pseudactinotalea sp. HY158 TaxID=2654547 RepID=UPI00129CA552|nr:hypothetical protein [Pseudactinotalea sp. HY158]QGH70510.1 hypothetical protein GCE65_14170 [Pseudactinotalea sp. HY158]
METAARGPGGPRSHRTRTYVIAGVLGAFVLAVAVLVAWNLTRGGEPAAAVTSTTTGPVPTATGTPAAHDQTAFTAAQPATVLDYLLTGVEPIDVPGDPVESWHLTYTSPERTVDLVAGQWPERDAATAAFDAVLEQERDGAQEARDLGTVGAAGETVGHAWLITQSDGQGLLLWQNTTAVFTLTGPIDALEDFQLAYPL